MSEPNLPAKPLKQIGQAVAVSLVALAAEAALTWLRRRIRQGRTVPTSAVHALSSPDGDDALSGRTSQRHGVVAVFSQRVVEVWQPGEVVRGSVEQVVWRGRK